jgi:hypothetical protein
MINYINGGTASDHRGSIRFVNEFDKNLIFNLTNTSLSQLFVFAFVFHLFILNKFDLSVICGVSKSMDYISKGFISWRFLIA